MRLLLIEVSLLNKDGQYADMKVTKSVETEQIKHDAIGQEQEAPFRTFTNSITLAAPVNLSIPLFLKVTTKGLLL